MDKTCQKIIRSMLKNGTDCDFVCGFADSELCDFSITQMSDEINENASNIRAAVKFLEEQGHVQYQYLCTSSGKKAIGFRLSHKGVNWKYFERKETLDYIAEKWVDFVSAIISLIALILSIASFFRH